MSNKPRVDCFERIAQQISRFLKYFLWKRASRDCVREGIGYIAPLDLLLVDFVGVLGVCQEVGH